MMNVDKCLCSPQKSTSSTKEIIFFNFNLQVSSRKYYSWRIISKIFSSCYKRRN